MQVHQRDWFVTLVFSQLNLDVSVAYLCEVWVFGLLLQKINKAHAKLHHKVSELRLKSLVELVGVSPHQLVH